MYWDMSTMKGLVSLVKVPAIGRTQGTTHIVEAFRERDCIMLDAGYNQGRKS